MEYAPYMEILKLTYFIFHLNDKRDISVEYSIKSNRKELTNIIIMTEAFLPNLTVRDENNHVLPVLSRRELMGLFDQFEVNEPGLDKLEDFYSEMESKGLHLIWIKLPKEKSMADKEIRTITLHYSPYPQLALNSIFKLTVQSKPYSLYYNFISPDEFNFGKIKYNYLENDKIKQNSQPPAHARQFRTNNSISLQIPSGSPDFEIEYSFRPKPNTTASLKVGVWFLSVLSSLILAWNLGISLNYLPASELFDKQIEIGLFVMGGSLILPPLIANQGIRTGYIRWYLVPMFLGALILLWKLI